MLDSDLGALYGVETKMLNRAVKRNAERFPEGFMFHLTKEEYAALLRYQFGTLKRGQHRKYFPYLFTENGVAMLSNVLNSLTGNPGKYLDLESIYKNQGDACYHKGLKQKTEDMEK